MGMGGVGVRGGVSFVYCLVIVYQGVLCLLVMTGLAYELAAGVGRWNAGEGVGVRNWMEGLRG